jgi:putative chitinase
MNMDKHIPLTYNVLRAAMPKATNLNIGAYNELLNQSMIRFKITGVKRQAAFLAQVAHESGSLSDVEENLNYSAEGLLRVWPRLFKDVAKDYAHKPQAIANRAYANRMGNGDEASGDGWRHRGAGLIQLTGKENQTHCANFFGIPVQDMGEWLLTPYGAAMSAGWFWSIHKQLNAYADKDEFLKLSIRINGKNKDGLPNGWEDRVKNWKLALAALKQTTV